jgi:hypothetical protein
MNGESRCWSEVHVKVEIWHVKHGRFMLSPADSSDSNIWVRKRILHQGQAYSNKKSMDAVTFHHPHACLLHTSYMYVKALPVIRDGAIWKSRHSATTPYTQTTTRTRTVLCARRWTWENLPTLSTLRRYAHLTAVQE